MYRVVLIPGDGIGQEVIPAAASVLMATGLPICFEEAQAGWGCFEKYGVALPESTVRMLEAADAALFGAVSSPSQRVEGYRSPIVALRQRFDLYANVRPIFSLPVPGSRQGVDFVIVRENTEGLYAGRERREGDTAVAERVITRRASERIARFACELARRRRGHLTIVHKANILRESDGLFREAALSVALGYPELELDELLVDTAAMKLIQTPEWFDVLVTTNLFGDILSDEAAALVGGLGVAASGNIGDTHAIFEPVHGSAPDIAGKGIANPTAAILASAMLLEHLGEPATAAAVRRAVVQVLEQGLRTPDLGGEASTRDVAEAVAELVRRSAG